MQRYNKYTTTTNLSPFIFLIRFLFNIFIDTIQKSCALTIERQSKNSLSDVKPRRSVSVFHCFRHIFTYSYFNNKHYIYIYLYNYIYKYIISYWIRWSNPICFDWNGETLKRFAVLLDGSFATRMANAPLVLNRKTVWKKSTKELAHSKGLPIFAE